MLEVNKVLTLGSGRGNKSVCASIYLRLVSGVPPGLIVLGQQHLLVKQVHPLLPLDVQCGTHPQRRLTTWLGALMITDVNTLTGTCNSFWLCKRTVHQLAKSNVG